MSYEGEDNVDIAPLMPRLQEFASKAGFVLEIGCGAGNGSCRAFRRGLALSPAKDKLHISVDIMDGHPCYDRPTESYWHKVTGDSRDRATAEAVKAICGDRRADIIFIDTDHTYEMMEKELPNWAEFAHDGTIWLFHDTWMFGCFNEMQNAIKEFSERNGWRFDEITRESHGLGRMQRWAEK
jgi:cephalosporin hydroxylase